MPDQVQPVDYRPDGQGGQVPVYNNATPGGFGAAILDLLRALTKHGATPPMGALNPGNREVMKEAGVESKSMAPQTSDLGNQF